MSIALVALEVLKWIGILLLFLLGILLFFLFLVLFSPIRYEAEGEKKQDIKGWVKINWIFHLIRFSLSFSASEGIQYSAKILTFSLLDSEMEPKPKKEKRRKKQLEPVKKPKPEKPRKTTTKEQKTSPVKTKKAEKNVIAMEMQKAEKTEYKEKKTPELQNQEKKPPVIRKIKMTHQIQEEKSEEQNSSPISEEEQKKEELNKDYFLKMSMEEKKKLFTITKKFVCRIWKSVFPKKIRADLEFGTGDPALTGKILGAASIAQIMLGEECRVKADFQQAMIEGDLWIKGRIFLASLGFGAIRFVLEKPIRKIIVLYWKG